MAKYVDADKLIKALKKTAETTGRYGDAVVAFEVCVKLMPAADVVSKGVLEQVRWERDVAIDQLAEYGIGFAEKKKDLVEVVRCKDCKHFMVEGKRYKSYYCDFHSNEAWGGVYVEPLEYCSCGERKADNER